MFRINQWSLYINKMAEAIPLNATDNEVNEDSEYDDDPYDDTYVDKNLDTNNDIENIVVVETDDVI
jgi:hypothetical protein